MKKKLNGRGGIPPTCSMQRAAGIHVRKKSPEVRDSEKREKRESPSRIAATN